MAVTINASTSAGLVQTADLSGQLALQANGTTVATVSSTGLNVTNLTFTSASTAMPAFSVYPSAAQTITNATATLIQCNVKSGTGFFDTAGAFNNTGSTVTLNGISVPAYAFAPPVAGYYLINCYLVANGAGFIAPQINVNGSTITSVSYTTNSNYLGGSVSLLYYLNGTSDYVQLYMYQNSGGSITTLASRPDLYRFSACLMRSA